MFCYYTHSQRMRIIRRGQPGPTYPLYCSHFRYDWSRQRFFTNLAWSTPVNIYLIASLNEINITYYCITCLKATVRSCHFNQQQRTIPNSWLGTSKRADSLVKNLGKNTTNMMENSSFHL